MHFKVLWPVKPALRACSGFLEFTVPASYSGPMEVEDTIKSTSPTVLEYRGAGTTGSLSFTDLRLVPANNCGDKGPNATFWYADGVLYARGLGASPPVPTPAPSLQTDKEPTLAKHRQRSSPGLTRRIEQTEPCAW